MPRNPLEIPLDKLGIICNAEGRDLPDHYAVYSKGVDPASPMGRLQPIKTLGANITGLGTCYNAVKTRMIQKSDGKYTLVYDDATDVKYVEDFYSAKTLGTALSGTDMKCAQANNQELHIGTGSGSTNKPKWVGYLNHKQFGATALTALQAQDAELTIGDLIGGVKKVFRDASYIYAISNDGYYVYKLAINGRSFVKKSPLYAEIVSGCFDIANSNVIILHKIGSSYVLDTLTSDLKLLYSGAITTDIAVDGTPSDMETTSAKVWISCSGDFVMGGVSPTKNFIWNMDIPTTSTAYTFTGRHMGTGQFYEQSGLSYNTRLDQTFSLPKLNLVRLESPTTHAVEHIGVIGQNATNLGGGSDIVIDYVYGYATVRNKNFMLIIGETFTKDGSFAPLDGKSKADICILGDLAAAAGIGLYDSGFLSHNASQNRLYVVQEVSSSSVQINSYPDYSFGWGLFTSYDAGSVVLITNASGGNAKSYTGILSWVGLSIPDTTTNKLEFFAKNNATWYYTVNNTSDAYTALATAITANIGLTISASSGISSGGVIESTKDYYYRVSYIYDGYQESPLSKQFNAGAPTTGNWFSLTLTLFDVGQFAPYTMNKKRVTAIRLYRAEGANGSSAPNTLYRMVRDIDLTEVNYADTTVDGKSAKQITLLENSVLGPSYEANTGMSETTDSSMINYALSAKLNGYHYVAACYKEDLPEAKNMIIRSKANRFDMFDWVNDYMLLPFIPVAMESFAGRLYVWSGTKILKINPDLFIEDEYEGYGIATGLEPSVNDYGMFWFDASSIYQMLPNGQVEDIGFVIRKSYDETNLKSFNNTLAGAVQPVILYSREKDCMFFFGAVTANAFHAWAYSFVFKQWYYYLVTSLQSDEAFAFGGKDNEIYVCLPSGPEVKKMFAGSNYEELVLITKKYDGGLQEQQKKFYKIKSSGSTSAPTITYDVNDGTALNKTLTSGALSSTYRKAKNIQIKIAMASGATSRCLDALEIIYRNMKGLR